MDSENLALLRGILRKDLDSVGMIPTGKGIEMAAGDDPDLCVS